MPTKGEVLRIGCNATLRQDQPDLEHLKNIGIRRKNGDINCLLRKLVYAWLEKNIKT